MAKMRVYELAQQMGRPNKEVIEFLKSQGVDIKSHMSNVEEEFIHMTKEKLGNRGEKPKAEKQPEGQGDSPKKKKKIIRVFHAQNASDGGKERPNKRRQGDRRQKPQESAPRASENAVKERVRTPETENRQNADARSKEPAAAKPEVSAQAVRSASPETKEAPRPESSERRASGGANNQNNQNNQNNRNNRSAFAGRSQGAGKPNRRGGQTDGSRNQNNRPPREQGAGSQRSGSGQGPRSQNGNGRDFRSGNRSGQEGRFGQNRTGQRPQGAGQRSQGGRPQGTGGRPQGGRPQGAGQNRPGRKNDQELFIAEIGKQSKDSRKERESKRENKGKKDYGKGTNRPNQSSRRPNMRIPKALQKPVHQPKEEKKPEIKEIVLPEKMTIRELAEKMKMQPSVIVKKLFLEGNIVTVNHEIDFDKAQEIALDYNIIAEQEEKVDIIGELLKEEEEDEATLTPRPPVVCVMGHVDHGKTSLLDTIRNTHVTDKEAGGITQHIGAYVVSINGQKITFLDTPGHEAFTAMRMRGANATDIAILVVAADDGVMPQTVEAISHAKAAGTEIIVAVNKIDKPSANVERVKQELSEYELIPEDWGGSTIFVPVSAKNGEGITSLLEMILLTAEVSELKANAKRAARGLVIEAELDKGKGPVATILVQKGTLHVGDFIAAGACSGKVRAMMDDKGRRVKEAGPSMPVEILGLSDVPNAGEIIMAFDSDKEAKNFAAAFISENKNRLLEETKAKLSLDDLFSQIQEGNLKELPIIVKADVQGSVEAVKQSLNKLSNEEVLVKVIHGGVGAINESDVTLAATSNAIIIGFNVRPDSTAKSMAEQEGVDLRLYKVIYQAIEDVEAAMKGMLDPIFEEQVIGHGEVRQIFKASGVGTIAGSYVTDGMFQRNCKVRVSREGEQIFEGELASLKRFKDDVKEVKAGYECGLVLEGFNDILENDQVEAYIMVEVPR